MSGAFDGRGSCVVAGTAVEVQWTASSGFDSGRLYSGVVGAVGWGRHPVMGERMPREGSRGLCVHGFGSRGRVYGEGMGMREQSLLSGVLRGRSWRLVINRRKAAGGGRKGAEERERKRGSGAWTGLGELYCRLEGKSGVAGHMGSVVLHSRVQMLWVCYRRLR